jgi:hypothetical protein
MNSVKPSLTDEHLEGCMGIATAEIKPDADVIMTSGELGQEFDPGIFKYTGPPPAA